MSNSNNTYDYVFAGGGCAALSLLCQMAKYNNLHHKKILVIDFQLKQSNDRTWSFWEKTPNNFSHIAAKTWNNLALNYNGTAQTVNISPYTYKTIFANDFYAEVHLQLKVFTQLTFVNETIINITNFNKEVLITTSQNTYKATTAFNSIFNGDIIKKIKAEKTPFLWQHFIGFFVETPTHSFNTDVATWMDFGVHQQDNMSFMYILPFAPNKALIEYTVFSTNLLPNHVYQNENHAYLAKLNITNYNIYHTEQYAIPMTSHKFIRQYKNIINIGSLGGATRASTGFTFTGIQKQAKHIAHQLAQNKKPQYKYSFNELKHLKFDATLLYILLTKKQTGEQIFGKLFAKIKLQLLLKFLDGETTTKETLSIMKGTSFNVYIPAFLKALFKVKIK